MFKLPVFRSLRTVLVYHIFQALSRTFFVSLQISLKFGIILLPSRTASIYYHRAFHLSSVFYKILKLFLCTIPAVHCASLAPFYLRRDRPSLISVSASPASRLHSGLTARSPRLSIPHSLPFSVTGSRRICRLPISPAASSKSMSGLADTTAVVMISSTRMSSPRQKNL